jgi:hypothetical protein
METIRKMSEEEFVLLFLQSEIDSPRWGQQLEDILVRHGANRKLIDRANLSNQAENTLRAEILGEFRGYRRNSKIFTDFPDDADWEKVYLTKEDLKKVKYVDYSYWNELSGGSRLVYDGAKNIKAGLEPFGKSTENFFKAATALKSNQQFPPMILVAKNKTSELIVLEGHLRLTAYLMEPQIIPDRLIAVVGYSERFKF